MTGERFRTVVAIHVPEAEPLVGDIQRRHTPSGRRGMPPHVTLLSPFVGVEDFDQGTADRLTRALAGVPAFDLALAKVERFDPGVLYLSVEPLLQVRSLIRRVCDEFPDLKPYARYTPDTVIPHVTLAVATSYPDGVTRRDSEVFAAAEAEVLGHLPIDCRAEEVAVMADGPRGWTIAWRTSLR